MLLSTSQNIMRSGVPAQLLQVLTRNQKDIKLILELPGLYTGPEETKGGPA